MKLKYTKWDDVSLGLYKKLAAISGDNSLSEEEKNVEMAAVLCDCEPEDIWNMDINDARKLFAETSWLNDFKPDYSEPTKKRYELGGTTYDVCFDINRMTVAQYVDFQNVYGDGIKLDNMSEVLSCWFIPKGHKYVEDYDAEQTIKDIEEYLPFVEAQRLCYFFLMASENYIRALRIFSKWMMKREIRKVKDKALKQELKTRLKEIDSLYSSLSLTKWPRLQENHGRKSSGTK